MGSTLLIRNGSIIGRLDMRKADSPCRHYHNLEHSFGEANRYGRASHPNFPSLIQANYFFRERMKLTRSFTWSAVKDLNGGIIGGLPFVIAAARSASLIFCISAEVQSCVFIAALPLPSAPWHAEHLALNSASPAAVSAFAGALNRPAPAMSVPANTSVPSFFIFVCMLLPLPDEFFTSAADIGHNCCAKRMPDLLIVRPICPGNPVTYEYPRTPPSSVRNIVIGPKGSSRPVICAGRGL